MLKVPQLLPVVRLVGPLVRAKDRADTRATEDEACMDAAGGGRVSGCSLLGVGKAAASIPLTPVAELTWRLMVVLSYLVMAVLLLLEYRRQLAREPPPHGREAAGQGPPGPWGCWQVPPSKVPPRL